MSNPHDLPVVSENVTPDALAAADWLHAVGQPRGYIRIASIGPAGTSAHDVLNELQRQYSDDNTFLDVELSSSFEEAAEQVLKGIADFALVPSAYRDAAAFHWHPSLELAYVFVHRTPYYGLATNQDAAMSTSRAIVVAAMGEVEDLFFQLAPANLSERRIEHLKASSTSNAAAIVRAGIADVAVCNDLGRQEHGLSWIGSREGVDMVWMFFKRRP